MRRNSTATEKPHCSINHKQPNGSHTKGKWTCKRKDEEWDDENILSQCGKKFEINDMAASVLPVANVYNDYHVKYHSVSGGSALSQSMKYAEAWLYGSLNIKPSSGRSRSTFFNMHENFNEKLVNGDNDMPKYSHTNGTTIPNTDRRPLQRRRSEATRTFNDDKQRNTCDKCIASSTKRNSIATIRAYDTTPRRRMSSFYPHLKISDDTGDQNEYADPYDIMRRSRLSGLQSSTMRTRTKSCSPKKRKQAIQLLSPSATVSQLTTSYTEDKDVGGLDGSGICRKSILDCNINPYDLVKQVTPAGPADHDDFDEEVHLLTSDDDVTSTRDSGTTAKTKKKHKLTLRYKFKTKIRAQYFKNVLTKDVPTTVPAACDTVINGISIAGQKIRVFNPPDTRGSAKNEGDWITDMTTGDDERPVACRRVEASDGGSVDGENNDDDDDGDILRPKRPPRRKARQIKENGEREATRTHREGCDIRNDDVAKIITTPAKCPDVRSILKKPLCMSSSPATHSRDTFESNKRNSPLTKVDEAIVELNVASVSVTSSITTTVSIATSTCSIAASTSSSAIITNSAAVTASNTANNGVAVAGSIVTSKNFYSTMTFDGHKKANKKVKKQVQFKGMQDQIIEDESGSKTIMDVRRHVRRRPITEETGYASYDIGDVERTLTATTPQQSQSPDRPTQTLSTEKQRPSQLQPPLHYHVHRDNENGNTKLNINNRSINGECGDDVTSLPIAQQIVVNECSSSYQIVSSSMNATATPPTSTSTFVSFDSPAKSNAFTRFSQSDDDETRNIDIVKEPISRLHRTLSECISSKPLVINLKCGPFNDTMRLRIRANQQNDVTNKLFNGRQVATIPDSTVNVVKSSYSRPTIPPPLPPFVTLASVDATNAIANTKPYLPPRQYFPFSKSENLVVSKICSVNIPINDAKSSSNCCSNSASIIINGITADKSASPKTKNDDDMVNVNVKIPSLTETFLQNRTYLADKDRNLYSGSVVKIDVKSDTPFQFQQQLQSSSRQQNIDNRTIVTISPSTETISQPEILSTDTGNGSWNERTSIAINSDESSMSIIPPHLHQNTNTENANNYKRNSIVNVNTGEIREQNTDLNHSGVVNSCQSKENDTEVIGSVEGVKYSVTRSDCDGENNENDDNDDNSVDRKSTTSSYEDSLGTISDSNTSKNSSNDGSCGREFSNYDNGFSLHYMSCKINEKFVEGQVDSPKTIVCENEYDLTDEPIYEEIAETPPALRRTSTPPPPPLPLKPPPDKVDDIGIIIPPRSIFEGASKYDILKYLACAKERCKIPEEPEFVIDETTYGPDADCDSDQNTSHTRNVSSDLSSRVSHLSNVSDSSDELTCFLTCSNGTNTSEKTFRNCADIERNDSGVGSETSKCSRSKWQHIQANSLQEDQQHTCEDCDQEVEPQTSDSGLTFAPLVCRKCSKKRIERREIIAEIVETEEKYGRDLRIILDEFYKPMLVAGLLTPEQLLSIFLNVEELLEHNTTLAEKLRDGYEIAVEQGDEDLLTFNIGKIFLDAAPMLHAFESYCTRQGNAALLLAHLEKEKELLKIFLRVSQMENTVLRRMNLNSFLMVPVQRVTKYPLLLARLHKVTPEHHTIQRELLKEAQHNIELHLEHINSLTKDIGSTKIWRRISMMNGRRVSGDADDIVNIKLQKIAVEVLEWGHDEVRFAMEGRLLYAQPTDYNWKRTGRTMKVVPVNALLVTLGKPTENYNPDCDDLLMFPQKNGIREASLLLMKEKGGKYSLVRNPLFLDHCIIYCDDNFEEYFEVQEIPTKDTYIFKGEDDERTKRWCKQLQYHSQGLGCWRKRRNALANIMINGMQIRS